MGRESLLLVVVASALAGCDRRALGPVNAAQPLATGEVVTANATVRFVPIEGGCWALETPGGRYEPVALPAAFRRDGLAVYVVLRAAPLAATTCMIAPLVAIDSIRAP